MADDHPLSTAGVIRRHRARSKKRLDYLRRFNSLSMKKTTEG
jgi:hypothetical protein